MMQLDLFESKNIAILRLAESDATEIIRIPGWLKVGKRVDRIYNFYYQKFKNMNLLIWLKKHLNNKFNPDIYKFSNKIKFSCKTCQ